MAAVTHRPNFILFFYYMAYLPELGGKSSLGLVLDGGGAVEEEDELSLPPSLPPSASPMPSTFSPSPPPLALLSEEELGCCADPGAEEAGGYSGPAPGGIGGPMGGGPPIGPGGPPMGSGWSMLGPGGPINPICPGGKKPSGPPGGGPKPPG